MKKQSILTVLLICLFLGLIILSSYQNYNNNNYLLEFKEESIIIESLNEFNLNNYLQIENIELSEVEYEYNESILEMVEPHVFKIVEKDYNTNYIDTIVTAKYKDLETNILIKIELEDIYKNHYLSFDKRNIIVHSNETFNLSNYLKLENIKLSEIEYEYDKSILEMVKPHIFKVIEKDYNTNYLNTKITAKYKNMSSNISVKIEIEEDNKNNEIENAIYFYQNNDEFVYLEKDWQNKNKFGQLKEEYDKKYKYLSRYICKDENNVCHVYSMGSNAATGKLNYNLSSPGVFIREDFSKFTFFDFKNEKVLENYDSHIDILCNNINGNGTLINYRNNKKAIVNNNGKVISSYYDGIMYGINGAANFSNKYKIGEYEENGKHGILSLESGKEITEAIYDEVFIYEDSIIIKQNGLEYAVDQNGNIKSSGYKNMLYSTDKVIVIEENGLIDIIDYLGNSKIKEKIDSYGHTEIYLNRCGSGGSILPTFTIIPVNEKNEISLCFKFSKDMKQKEMTYIYNQETGKLTLTEPEKEY